MNVLVTGCAGFIGSHLAESLLEDGFHVIGVDCFNENYGRRAKLRNLERARDWGEFEFVPIDLSRGDLADLVADCEVVFHLAAEPGVRSSWGHRFQSYVRNNIVATQLLLDTLRTSPSKRVVYASSSSIYGNAERLPTPENVIPEPISPYGTTKLAGEHLCQLYHANFAMDCVCLRYFTVYGPRQRPDMAFHSFIEAARAGNSIEIYGDGHQTRDFTFVDDIVAATRAAGAANDVSGEVFNVGGGSQIAVNEVIRMIGELTGRELTVRYSGNRSGDVTDTGADISLAEAKLGFRPQVGFEEGLQAQFEWLLATAR
jgi:nucleoside-diphosphate-sugar epimerase